MKSVVNVLADCEVYQSILVMKPLTQKSRLLVLLSYQINVSRNVYQGYPLSSLMRVAACHADRTQNELHMPLLNNNVPDL
jgi:hypothetical protein